MFTGPSGKAVFEKVRVGSAVFVNASKPGLEGAGKTLQLKKAQVVSLELVLVATSEKQDLKVKVFDSFGEAVAGVKIEYYSLRGVQLGTKFTDARGNAKISFDGVNHAVSLDFFKEGFEDKTGLIAYFNKKTLPV